MALVYRPAGTADIQAVSKVYWESVLDVYRRHGFEDRRPVYPVNPFYEFCLREEPEGFFVAEEDGSVIGAAFSWVRGHTWFLSHLFVDPLHQGRGIGGTLLELSLQHGITSGTTLHAVITMAFNASSLALYMKNGMYPVQDIYLMKATQPYAPAPDTLMATEKPGIRAWQSGEMDTIDVEALGMPRPLHHQYYLGREEASCHIFRVGGRVVAYGYSWNDGRIGPVTAVEDAPYEAVLRTVMGHAQRISHGLSLMVPGSNTIALKTALDNGFTLFMPYVLLASEPFGYWNHYLFHSPGML